MSHAAKTGAATTAAAAATSKTFNGGKNKFHAKVTGTEQATIAPKHQRQQEVKKARTKWSEIMKRDAIIQQQRQPPRAKQTMVVTPAQFGFNQAKPTAAFKQTQQPPLNLLEMMKMAKEVCKIVTVYTDGACPNNGNKEMARAGYGVFFGDKDERNVAKPVLGPDQTNNRAELLAILEALTVWRTDPELSKYQLRIMTDSIYSRDAVKDWSLGWAKKQWCKADGKPIVNLDVIQDIYAILGPEKAHARSRFEIEYIKAHAGKYGNTEADALAVLGAKTHPPNYEVQHYKDILGLPPTPPYKLTQL
jgi:ribonuclease HI